MADLKFALDPSVLPPDIDEKKGSLLLRSNHMKYAREVLTAKWHEDRETEPKDYDICSSEKKRKNNSTYNRIGNVTDGSLKDFQTTTQEAMTQVSKFKEDYRTREIHAPMVNYDNFFSATSTERKTAQPALPRHHPDHAKRYLETTHMVDFKYPFDWTPIVVEPPKEERNPQFPRGCSEFTDNDGHKRWGINTFRDCPGSVDKSLETMSE